jgi:7-cyano-7-deazaguanine synthase in queuosine biosynthesis
MGIPMDPKITIEDISVYEKKEVRYELSYSRNLRRFLTDVDPYIRYSENVSDVPTSILAVPLLATLCPVAWIRGADVYIERIDEAFRQSLPALHNAYEQLYPDAPFDTDISLYYKEAVDNEVRDTESKEEKETAVLFTGGIDSTATYLRHREENPHLITVRKETETRENAWKNRTRMIDAFATENGIDAHNIETNIKSKVDKFMVSLYHRHQLNESWDRAMFFGIGYPGFTAPLTYNRGITKIYQSADYLPHEWYPKSSQPSLVENLRWANTVVKSDGVGLTRQNKVEIISEYFEDRNTSWKVGSCDYGGDNSLSCNSCGTCFRTITGFIVADYDPVEYGFDINEETFEQIKVHLNEEEFSSDSGKLRFWLELQDRADPEQVDLPYEGVTEFVAWLADTTITKEWSRPLPVARPDYEASLKRRLCIKLPYPLDAYVIRYYFGNSEKPSGKLPSFLTRDNP